MSPRQKVNLRLALDGYSANIIASALIHGYEFVLAQSDWGEIWVCVDDPDVSLSDF